MDPTPSDLLTLRENEERLRAFMRHAPMLAFMKDAEGRYVYVNPRMEREFQITIADLAGRSEAPWLSPDLARSARDINRQVLSTGTSVERVEAITGPDGAERQWLILKFPFTNARGERFVGGVAVDVTAQQQVGSQLRASEDRYRQLVESSQGLICTHDMAGNLLSANAAALRTLGYGADDLPGRNLKDLLTPRARERFAGYLERINSTGEDTGLMEVITRDGRTRTWQYHNVRVQDAHAAPYVLGHAQDVTELREAQEQLKRLSLSDELTGLMNRRGFLNTAPHLLALATSSRQALTMLFADVDGLKHVNDSHGHDAGSALIVRAADVLKQTFRAADLLARVGGDEFVVLAIVPDDAASIISRRMDLHLTRVNAIGTGPVPLQLSVGVVHIPPGNTLSLEELLHRADQKMYEQKRQKRAAP